MRLTRALWATLGDRFLGRVSSLSSALAKQGSALEGRRVGQRNSSESSDTAGGFIVFESEKVSKDVIDPLSAHAERIFAERQERLGVIAPDLLGEPGWDILLCAYIAGRKGTACLVDEVAAAIGTHASATKRWVLILQERGMLVTKLDAFTISIETECKLSNLFHAQIAQAASAQQKR